MKRLLIVGGLIVAVLAVAVYRAKLGAEETEAKNTELQTEARKVTEEIAVLKAEEAYLTRPERIGPIARERLGLQPAKPDQYTAPEALTRRLGEERLTLPETPAPAQAKAVKPAPKPAAETPAQTPAASGGEAPT
jgi:cell division protein FtsL